jgi:redox-sensitive bicupin YhaK (pirin superfamily)
MIELVIDQRRRDLGGFEVGRVLPFAKRRMVGPFVFFDHMGPMVMPAGVPRSVDVRPHPHIVGERNLWWNFVSSSKDRLEQAKADWAAGRFALPPHDHDEFIPLPAD